MLPRSRRSCCSCCRETLRRLRILRSRTTCVVGDFFAAVGAGIMSGAGEIAGFDELMKGDFAGAMEKRKDVWEAVD